MKKLLLLLLIIPGVFAYSISDWPSFFVHSGKFDAKYVVGAESSALDVVSATVVSTSLAKFENVTTSVGTSVLDSEVGDIRKIDAIVIGSPCDNSAASVLLGNPSPCYSNFSGGVGYIRLFENGGRVQLLITGLSDKDRSAAAKFLAKNSLSGLGKEHSIQSGSGSVPEFFSNKTVANVSSNVSEKKVFNVTNNVSKPVNVSKNVSVPVVKKTPVKVGEYEPLDGIPVQEKGFFSRLWSWFKSLFW